MAEKKTDIRIVIIEDHPVLANMLSIILAKTSQCQSVIFHKAKEAMAYFEKQAHEPASGLPDLVILDLGLPDASGLDVLRKIKSFPSLRDLPVIVNTGSDSLEDLAEAKQWEKVIFLKKGMDRFTLSDIIAKMKADGAL